jgi:pimeloyl-ACP methyl ester carboxylesterase
MQALLSRPARMDEASITDHYVDFFRVIGSPGFPNDEDDLRRRVILATRRSFHPAGTLRQLTAVGADTRRADQLPGIKTPTIVLHGRADPLVPLACGHDTARRITGSKFHVVDGMGHDLVPGVIEQLLAHLLPHLEAAS